VYWAPEAMVFKHAIVQTASVAEAVLQYGLKMIEADPRVQPALGTDWVWVDWKDGDSRRGIGKRSRRASEAEEHAGVGQHLVVGSEVQHQP
jgi:hypothetical protein